MKTNQGRSDSFSFYASGSLVVSLTSNSRTGSINDQKHNNWKTTTKVFLFQSPQFRLKLTWILALFIWSYFK